MLDVKTLSFKNLPLTPYDRSTFYGGDARDYTDYPFYKVSRVT